VTDLAKVLISLANNRELKLIHPEDFHRFDHCTTELNEVFVKRASLYATRSPKYYRNMGTRVAKWIFYYNKEQAGK
jgi:hypothetical protein